jgi:hypothetical protein
MSDPLFGPLDFGGAAALFGDGVGTLAPTSAPFEDDGFATSALDLNLDPTIDCGLVPWHSGAFALLLRQAPAGSLAIGGDGGSLTILAQTRVLRPDDGHQTLIVVDGSVPTADAGPLVLSAFSDEGVSRFPLRPTPAAFDRTLATLIGQALTRLGAGTNGRRNWTPLLRRLATISELAVRADLSLPIGPGLALVLDGDLGTTEEEPLAFALDGGQLTATRARVAVDPQTGRSLVLLPTLAARCFVLLDDGLVDVTCPPGATRLTLARTTDAMPLRSSECELLLDLASELALDVGSRVPDWLPLPHALGWRGADGGSMAVVGSVAVEAGTILFLATENREHELANLMVRDVAHPAEALFTAADPIAAFHPDAERFPDRLHIVLLLPRRLGAGALHVSLAGTSAGGGWVRTLDAPAGRTQSILRAWLPPPPSEAVYLRMVAASVRATASRAPVVMAAEVLPASVQTADHVVAVVGFDAEVDALMETLRSLPVALRRSIPVVIVLRSFDPGHDRTMDRLATTARTEDIEIGTVVLAGAAGATAAISAAFARLRASAILFVDAGARFAEGDARSPFRGTRSRRAKVMALAGGSDAPSGALLSRRLVEQRLGAVDSRLATLPAVLADLARVATGQGDKVAHDAGFALEPDGRRGATFEALVDHAMLTDPRHTTAHRGTA